jgi:orotidine-5'-phosphate decarboxylase
MKQDTKDQDHVGRIMVALDYSSADEAKTLLSKLQGIPCYMKVGMQLFYAAGPSFVVYLKEQGYKVFLDLKMHDIPNTVSRAAEEAVKLGVKMFNLHATGGVEMMRETAERCRKLAEKLGQPGPMILAVTILTSLDEGNLNEVGLVGPVRERVVRLAELAQRAGVDGVVASPQEILPIRQRCGPKFIIVTPGIRPAFAEASKDDQKRDDCEGGHHRGADYIIGRPIRSPRPSQP